jgi:hypothetical protein
MFWLSGFIASLQHHLQILNPNLILASKPRAMNDKLLPIEIHIYI